jgi:hypothetical protein
LSDDGGMVTPGGEEFFLDFSIDLRPPSRRHRVSAARASIGASVGRISRAPSGPLLLRAASISAGSRASATLVRCSSPTRANAGSAKHSGSIRPSESCARRASCGPIRLGLSSGKGRGDAGIRDVAAG